MIRLTLFLEYFPYFPLLSPVKPLLKTIKALEVFLDHLIGLSDLEFDKKIIVIAICSKKLTSEDKKDVFITAHVLARSSA